jgi:hypothetical protein
MTVTGEREPERKDEEEEEKEKERERTIRNFVSLSRIGCISKVRTDPTHALPHAGSIL